MKLKKIIEAKEAVERLSNKKITDYRKAREIVKLRKAVMAEFDFYCEEEKKAIELYAEKTEEGTPAFLEDGRLKLKDADAKEAFEAQISALLETVVDGVHPIMLAETHFRSTTDIPTPEDMIALEGIVDFAD